MDGTGGAGDGAAGRQRRLIWRPNSEPQRRLLSCPVYEVFFGGARGGGKTDGVLGEWAQHARRYGENAVGLMVRRTSVQLAETVERARQIFRPIGAKFTSKPDNCVMPNGARLNFRYLERDQDAEGYQGHSYTRVYVEEAGNFPDPAPLLKLHATLRSGAGVPCRMRLTGNPGGPGHHWLKARYIDPTPPMVPLTDPETGLARVYIPSRVADNVSLDQAAYVAQLRQSGSPELVRAWLEGDWDVIAGAFFPEFSREKHVIEPCELPAHWHRYRAMDWGSARPFCVLWVAVSDGELPQFPRGALIVYREWYGTNGQPNVGLRMPAEEVGAEISARESRNDERIQIGVLDPAAFSSDGGPSIAERLARMGAIFRRADNARVSRAGAMGGWDQVRSRLNGDGERPGLFIFNTCQHLIRTLPALQHDADKPEDVDTDAEDHAPDTLRYACMARPYVVDRKVNPRVPALGIGPHNEVTFDDLWKLSEADNERRRL